MKFALLILLFAFAGGCSLQKVESQKLTQPKASPESLAGKDSVKTSVVVELFTSEGCSSCPPAEKTLDFLDRNQPYFQAEVIALAFHVDYWDRLGWKDPFSTAAASRRQEDYKQKLRLPSVYTPQMIVDGRAEFVGSDDRKAADAILAAATAPKAKIEIVRSGETFRVSVAGMPMRERTTVFLAVTENELESAITRGENAGRKLVHRAVVRELRTLGEIDRTESVGEFKASVVAAAEWRAANVNLVAFLQENESRRIVGATRVAFSAK